MSALHRSLSLAALLVKLHAACLEVGEQQRACKHFQKDDVLLQLGTHQRKRAAPFAAEEDQEESLVTDTTPGKLARKNTDDNQTEAEALDAEATDEQEVENDNHTEAEAADTEAIDETALMKTHCDPRCLRKFSEETSKAEQAKRRCELPSCSSCSLCMEIESHNAENENQTEVDVGADTDGGHKMRRTERASRGAEKGAEANAASKGAGAPAGRLLKDGKRGPPAGTFKDGKRGSPEGTLKDGTQSSHEGTDDQTDADVAEESGDETSGGHTTTEHQNDAEEGVPGIAGRNKQQENEPQGGKRKQENMPKGLAVAAGGEGRGGAAPEGTLKDGKRGTTDDQNRDPDDGTCDSWCNTDFDHEDSKSSQRKDRCQLSTCSACSMCTKKPSVKDLEKPEKPARKDAEKRTREDGEADSSSKDGPPTMCMTWCTDGTATGPKTCALESCAGCWECRDKGKRQKSRAATGKKSQTHKLIGPAVAAGGKTSRDKKKPRGKSGAAGGGKKRRRNN